MAHDVFISYSTSDKAVADAYTAMVQDMVDAFKPKQAA